MTKIDIISGFLGAGKTTLIKKLLDEAFQGEKIVLIENEFGEIGIDGGFLKDAGVEINEINDMNQFKEKCQDIWYLFEDEVGSDLLNSVIEACTKG